MTEPRVFGCATWFKALTLVAFMAFTAAAALLLYKDEASWLSFAALGLAVLALVGVADAFTTRVTLADEYIEIVRNLRRKAWPKEAFTSAASAKGCPIVLVQRDGGKVEIPDAVAGLHVNTLRAWLKREHRVLH